MDQKFLFLYSICLKFDLFFKSPFNPCKCTIGMSTDLHQTEPRVALPESINQTPDLNQRNMKHSFAIFHIDLRYVFELMMPP